MGSFSAHLNPQAFFRRTIIFTIVSLIVLFVSSLTLFLTSAKGTKALFIGIPVERIDDWVHFADENGISYITTDGIVVRLDHYNPEQLTVDELKERFLPDDDRLTPFLKELPKLFDYESDGRKMRLIILEKPFPFEQLRKWDETASIGLMFAGDSQSNLFERIFFFSVTLACFALSVAIQRKARFGLIFLATVFAAVFLSGSLLVLNAAVFIGNVFLALWRKWQPHREYFIVYGEDLLERRDKIFIGVEAAAAVCCAVLPPFWFPGERLASVAAIAMACFGIFWGAAVVLRAMSQPRKFHFVMRPLIGQSYKLPFKSAGVEIALGCVAAVIPLVSLLFFRTPSIETPLPSAPLSFDSISYEEIYEEAQNQPRGTLNAVGYLEEKVFQYCYRYEKLERLPPPGYEVTVPRFFYDANSVQNEKITIEIFTEDGFKSIIEKVKSDPLSVYFSGGLIAPGTAPKAYAVWIVASAFYFILLMPFFRISVKKNRIFEYKGRV